MDEEALNPAQQSEYRWLRQQVDRLEGERYRTDARPNVQQELHTARRELREFVSDLKKWGVST
jgi:hypothetical protein|tara:strand:+ start:3769 stop:3957 length:189 start_codon:yes stop_codon:yes gene_type:complete